MIVHTETRNINKAIRLLGLFCIEVHIKNFDHMQYIG